MGQDHPVRETGSNSDIVNDGGLDEIGVARVATRIFANPPLACDGLNGTAGMVSPRTQVPVGRLVGAAIRLLEPMTDTEAETLRVLLQPLMPPKSVGPTWEQRAFFDDDPT